MGPSRNPLIELFRQQRVFPTPPYVSNPQDNIFVVPPDPATRTLEFDPMDQEKGIRYEQLQLNPWAPMFYPRTR